MDCLNFPLAQAAFSLLAQGTAEAAAPVSEGMTSGQYLAIAITLAVLILPFVVSGWIAKALRMPDYATRIGFILFAIAASTTVLSFGKLGRGIDLRGGTILVYEIDPTKGFVTSDEAGGQSRVNSSQLIPSLIKRINPSGTQEIVIRPYGETKIEIIIPEVDQAEVDRIKRIIEQAGILRFAILANPRDHQRQFEIAREQADNPSQRIRLNSNVIDVDGTTPVGFWAAVDRAKQATPQGLRPLEVDVSGSLVRNPADGRILTLPPGVVGVEAVSLWMDQNSIDSIQALMIVDPQLDITGEDIAFSSTGFDRDGSPLVRFKLTDHGSGRFHALTTNNAPDGQHRRQLCWTTCCCRPPRFSRRFPVTVRSAVILRRLKCKNWCKSSRRELCQPRSPRHRSPRTKSTQPWAPRRFAKGCRQRLLR